MNIVGIQNSIKKGFFLTQHALQKMLERRIDKDEISQAIVSGSIIEENPEDKYGPSCLILGMTETGRPIHALVSYSDPVWVITAYEPSDEDWIDYKIRK